MTDFDAKPIREWCDRAWEAILPLGAPPNPPPVQVVHTPSDEELEAMGPRAAVWQRAFDAGRASSNPGPVEPIVAAFWAMAMRSRILASKACARFVDAKAAE